MSVFFLLVKRRGGDGAESAYARLYISPVGVEGSALADLLSTLFHQLSYTAPGATKQQQQQKRHAPQVVR